MADISIDGLRLCATVSSSHNGGRVADDAQSHYDCGLSWAQIGAYEQALEAYRQALHLLPDLAEASAAMGSVYMTLGCWQEAVRSYQKAIQADPHLFESYYGLGSAYGRLGEYRLAAETYQQAFQRIPQGQPQLQRADDYCLECARAGEAQHDTGVAPDRQRADAEGFDFSALLSSPAARRYAVRQVQAST